MHVHNGEVDIYPSFVQVLCASSSRLMACDKEEVNMAVRMAELHCVKHGIWWCSIFYVGVGCPFIIRVENNLSPMRSSSMQSMERIVPLSVSTQS